MGLGGEEVGAPQVGVAIGVVGVYRVHVDRGLNVDVIEGLAHGDGGFEAVEPAANIAETQVADPEVDARVIRVHGPSARTEREGGLRRLICYCVSGGHAWSFRIVLIEDGL